MDVAPFPDIPVEIPVTAREEVVGVSDVIQEDPTQSDQERACLAAENSGMDFSSLLPGTLNEAMMSLRFLMTMKTMHSTTISNKKPP